LYKEFDLSFHFCGCWEAPDIADFAARLAKLRRAGRSLTSSFIPEDYLKAAYPELWLEMATMEGPNGPMSGGVWNRGFMKSLVWYAKDDFDASGYTIPETWDDLLALSDQIVADGGTPWCIGIESQAATGWVGTDWVEDVMLRTTSLENYDAWVAGDLKFDSPEVKNAFETVGSIWFKEGNVYGGRDQITTTFFADSPAACSPDPQLSCPQASPSWRVHQAFPESSTGTDFFYRRRSTTSTAACLGM
jgi:alpha-glucoside transport system substrate-binding protein